MRSTSEWRKDELFQEKVNATVEKIMIRKWTDGTYRDREQRDDELKRAYRRATELHKFLEEKSNGY